MKPFKVIIIGTGFGGIATAIRLLQRGVTDFHLLERRDFMGGTWCQNGYPGAAVDVHSPLYALSSERWVWSQMFAARDELTAYTNAILDKYNLRARATLNADVQEVRWDDARSRWVITAAAGVFEAQVVVNASGPLSKPVVPDLPGRDRFAGPCFHTARWDHTVDLRGKRVGIIGTGSTAAQVVPAIVDKVEPSTCSSARRSGCCRRRIASSASATGSAGASTAGWRASTTGSTCSHVPVVRARGGGQPAC
jgi:cation diffusion facilitator CzcD-associated flavoprotein CzcO